MEVILKFKLPEEDNLFQNALRGTDANGIIQIFDNYLRAKLKYGTSLTDDQCTTLEEVRKELTDLCESYNYDI